MDDSKIPERLITSVK